MIGLSAGAAALPFTSFASDRLEAFCASVDVDRPTLDAARAAGCSVVLARSEFFRRVGELLGPQS